MALPWLAGAAVAATVGYLASKDDDYDEDDDDYDEEKEEAERREKKLKKQAFKRAKNDFKIKWGVKYKENFETTEKYNEIQNKISKIEQEMKILEGYSI